MVPAVDRRPVRTIASPTDAQRVGLAGSLAAAAIPWVVTFDGLSTSGHRMLSAFLLAVGLWVSEAIPLHATAIGIILAEVLLVSDAAVVPVAADAPAAADFYAALANPVIVLFLGGFFIAHGAEVFTLDQNLARVLLRPFVPSPRRTVLGIMLITAVLSMFMSNTATTATMLAVLLPVIGTLEAGDPLRTALALSVPVAANVGGIATPVGTPPNAIALGVLADNGVDLTFLDWVLLALPLTLVVLLASWVVLMRLFPPRADHLDVRIDVEFDTSPAARLFYVVAALTVVGWLSQPLHGVQISAVSLVPVVILLATKVFGPDDLKAMPWDVLWLVSGGVALGTGVATTGLDAWLVGLVPWDSVPGGLLVVALAVVALGMSTVISSSATANLLIPIGVTLAASDAVMIAPLLAVLMLAIGSSLAMALPISTPPNAIAYATGVVEGRDLARSGIAVGAIGLAVFVVLGPPLWRLLGVL